MCTVKSVMNAPHTNTAIAVGNHSTADIQSSLTLPLSISELDLGRVYKGVNSRKAVGPDGIPGRMLKPCADQLAPMSTTIFNLSIANSAVPH